MMSSRMDDRDYGMISASLREVTQDYMRKGIPLSLTLSIPCLGEVACGKVFRAIRGKRIACLGSAGNTPVMVKLYFARFKAKRNWKRSDYGCRSFIERGIAAPMILYSGYLSEYGVYALVLEYIDGGIRIDEALDSIPEKEMRENLLDRLIETLATHHAAGVLQNDLHMGNFLIKDGTIYSLDGDQVVCRAEALGRKRSLANLTRLLASLPFPLADDLDARIEAYVHARNWSISDTDKASLKDRVLGIRRRNLSGYLEKVLRSRDPFLASSRKGFYSVIDKRHLDVGLPEILAASQRSMPAQGCLGRAGFRVFTVWGCDMLSWSAYGAGPLVLKDLWNAVRVWKNALVLKRIGLVAPEPVALALIKKLPFFWRCTVFFKPMGGKGLREFFDMPAIPEGEKNHIAAALTDAFARLHAMGITAGRIDPESIMVSGSDIVFLKPAAFRRRIFSWRLKQSKMADRFISGCRDIPQLMGLLTEHFKKRGLI